MKEDKLKEIRPPSLLMYDIGKMTAQMEKVKHICGLIHTISNHVYGNTQFSEKNGEEIKTAHTLIIDGFEKIMSIAIRVAEEFNENYREFKVVERP